MEASVIVLKRLVKPNLLYALPYIACELLPLACLVLLSRRPRSCREVFSSCNDSVSLIHYWLCERQANGFRPFVIFKKCGQGLRSNRDRIRACSGSISRRSMDILWLNKRWAFVAPHCKKKLSATVCGVQHHVELVLLSSDPKQYQRWASASAPEQGSSFLRTASSKVLHPLLILFKLLLQVAVCQFLFCLSHPLLPLQLFVLHCLSSQRGQQSFPETHQRLFWRISSRHLLNMKFR